MMKPSRLFIVDSIDCAMSHRIQNPQIQPITVFIELKSQSISLCWRFDVPNLLDVTNILITVS